MVSVKSDCTLVEHVEVVRATQGQKSLKNCTEEGRMLERMLCSAKTLNKQNKRKTYKSTDFVLRFLSSLVQFSNFSDLALLELAYLYMFHQCAVTFNGNLLSISSIVTFWILYLNCNACCILALLLIILTLLFGILKMRLTHKVYYSASKCFCRYLHSHKPKNLGNDCKIFLY